VDGVRPIKQHDNIMTYLHVMYLGTCRYIMYNIVHVDLAHAVGTWQWAQGPRPRPAAQPRVIE
jgi:hypothetical protein